MKTGNVEGKAETDFFGNLQTPFRLVNNKVIVPDEAEIERNPRSRSAKLRIAEKEIKRYGRRSSKQESRRGQEEKKRTSLKSILGGDILATDFFPPSNEVAGTYHGIHHLLHSQSLCQSTATDRK